MQEKSPEIKHDSINEMDRLIISIQKANNDISEKELAVKMGYKEGYFSQCRSRNHAPAKLLNALKANINSLQNANNETSQEAQKDDKGFTPEEMRELLRTNRDLSIANKDLAAANRKLAEDHGELVQLAKQAFNISLEKLSQVPSVPDQKDEPSSVKKHYEDLPVGKGQTVKKKYSPY